MLLSHAIFILSAIVKLTNQLGKNKNIVPYIKDKTPINKKLYLIISLNYMVFKLVKEILFRCITFKEIFLL